MFHKIITEELVHIGSKKEKELGRTAKNLDCPNEPISEFLSQLFVRPLYLCNPSLHSKTNNNPIIKFMPFHDKKSYNLF